MSSLDCPAVRGWNVFTSPRPWDVRWGRWVTCRGSLVRRYRRAGLACLFGAAVTSVGPTTPAMSPSGRPGVVGVVVRWARLVLGVLRQDNMGALVPSGACGLPVPSGRRTRARLGARWTCSWVPRHSLSLAGKGGCWEVVCTQRRPLPQAGVHPEDAEWCGPLPRRGSGRRLRRRCRRQRRTSLHRGGALGGGPPEGPW